MPDYDPFIAAQGIHSCQSLAEDDYNSSLKATPWAQGAESGSKEMPLIKTVKWSLLNANDETIPFSLNQLVKLGHHIKEKQLQRPKSDKLVQGGSCASARQNGTCRITSDMAISKLRQDGKWKYGVVAKNLWVEPKLRDHFIWIKATIKSDMFLSAHW